MSTKPKSDPKPIDLVLEHCRIDDAVAMLVLVNLAKRADWKTGKVYVRIKLLAEAVSKSVRTVQRKLKWLEDESFIKRVSSFDPETRRQRPNDYIVLPEPDDEPAEDLDAHGTPSEGDIDVTGEGDNGVTPKNPSFKNPPSEPFGSGTGEPAPDKKPLFSEGRQTLVRLGLNRKTAGDVIVRWLRDAEGDAPRVLAAIRSAGANAVLSPISWITAQLQPRTCHDRSGRQSEAAEATAGLGDWLRALEQSPHRHFTVSSSGFAENGGFECLPGSLGIG